MTIRAHQVPPTAALAGIPAGIQSQGVWAGRRQLFIRFAAEAETATMYTADALANELKRGLGRSTFHSISISGRDPLANVPYLCAAFEKLTPAVPVMLDCDGQRPDALVDVVKFVRLAQVTVDAGTIESHADRALQTLAAAAAMDIEHGLVLCADDRTTDAQILRLIERAHDASAATVIVIHPSGGVPVDRDRRWIMLMERASAMHEDVRLVLRLPAPTGMR